MTFEAFLSGQAAAANAIDHYVAHASAGGDETCETAASNTVTGIDAAANSCNEGGAIIGGNEGGAIMGGDDAS